MPDLPSGTLTFCFTDIEGSTQLFAKLGPRFLDLLEAHRRIVRDAITRHGGSEVKTEGDGFFLVFTDPVVAINACVDIERAMRGHPWPEDNAIKVRIGLHVGVGEPLEGDYMTYEVHETARISSAGHGGQILVSDTLRGVVESKLDDAIELLDLGVHELKDLKPFRLHQVAHPDLERRFPPLRATGRSRGYLPAATSTFVGRSDELDAVNRLLEDGRLVTVTGAGGMGKTRVALEVAQRHLGLFDDGVWFVDLASVAEPDRVHDVILEALGVLRDNDHSAAEQLVAYLARRRVLLVIDNCEHVIETVSDVIAEILSACRDVKIVATSREALGISGESAWRLRSLDTPTGSDLFVQRALSANPTLDLTGTRGVIEHIVERLDGIPLAIELAAARTRALAPEQIASRLDDRFRLLTGGSRTALARQRTLEAAVDWSYQLLEEDERALLRCLSAFAGGFELEAIETVWRDDALDVLQRLVDKSMVVTALRGDVVRYRLLETIRHYAWTKLVEEEETERIRDAHCAYYRDLVAREAEGLLDRHESDVAALFATEYDNIRAAIDRSAEAAPGGALPIVADLWLFWSVVGRVPEGRELMGATLASLDGAGDVGMLARAYAGAAHLSWIGSGGDETTRELAQRSLDLAQEAGQGPTWHTAWALHLLAVTGPYCSRDRDTLDRAIDVARETHAEFVLAHTLLAKADLLVQQLDFDEATAVLDEAIEVARSAGSSSTLGELLERKALVMTLRGNLDEACRVASEAVGFARSGPNVYFLVFTVLSLGHTKLVRGDSDAVDHSREARALARAHGLDYQEGRALFDVAWNAVQRRALDEGLAQFEECLALFRGLPAEQPSVALMKALTYEGIASCHALAGAFDAGREILQRNLEVARAVGLPWVLALAHNTLGWLEQEAGNTDEAEALHTAARTAVADVEAGWQALASKQAYASSLRGLAGVAHRRADVATARTLLDEASPWVEPAMAAPRLGTLLWKELEAELSAATVNERPSR